MILERESFRIKRKDKHSTSAEVSTKKKLLKILLNETQNSLLGLFNSIFDAIWDHNIYQSENYAQFFGSKFPFVLLLLLFIADHAIYQSVDRAAG